MEFIKSIFRYLYFLYLHLRGNPGVELWKVRLIEKTNEFNDVVTLKFEKPQDFKFKAGQYIHFMVPDAFIHPNYVRHMSMASACDEDFILFSMDLSSKTKFKRKVAASKVGDLFSIYNVRGEFTLDRSNSKDKICFIAGGVGITPFRSFIASKPAQEWELLYADDRGYCYEDFINSESLKDKIHKLNKDSIYPSIDSRIESVDDFYLCGSKNFVTAIRDYLLSKGIDDKRIILEDFGI